MKLKYMKVEVKIKNQKKSKKPYDMKAKTMLAAGKINTIWLELITYKVNVAASKEIR